MNKKHITHTLIKFLLPCLILLSGIGSVRAQNDQSVWISLPQVSEYPEITLFIDPVNRDGSPLDNLQQEQITLSEDGFRLELLDFQPLDPGIQLVTALNLSTPFAIQDINGQSRFDYIQESLLNWAQQPLDSGADDLSLLVNNNFEVVHTADRTEWYAALEELSPELRELESNLNVLSRAIEIASDPIEQQGMKRVVLFYTSQPTSDSFDIIDNLISLAQTNQVRVYSILISSPAFFETAGAQKLRTLSAETGGKFLTFSGAEPLADLGQILLPLRSTYALKYQSSIISAGMHTLELSISSSPADLNGDREFFLDVQPPNPIFLTPPRKITRTPFQNNTELDQEVSFEPTSLALPVLVEFPDRHPRELEELIFRVDGEITSVITAPPFDEFIWNLEEFEVSGTHYLTLEAVDSMGLSRLSVETPIEVEVNLPRQDIGDLARKNAAALAGLGGLLVLGLILFGLISRGTIHPGVNRALPWIKSQGKRAAHLVQAIIPSRKITGLPSTETDYISYRLIPISDLSRALFPEPIQVRRKEISLGNLDREDLICIKHPSILPEHATINILDNHEYQLTDHGSAAGSWINYQQITSSEPQLLKDGDIINIGEAGFRFQILSRPHSGSKRGA